jgi:putative ABC transport system permease protein
VRFLALPVKNLMRRPARSAFAAVGVALAVGTFVAMSAVFGSIAPRWNENMVSRGLHAIVVQQMQVDWLASSLPETLVEEVARMPGVRYADGELLAFLTAEDGTALLASGWARGSRLWDTLVISEGTLPGAGGEALAGDGVAAALGLGVGDRIELDGLGITVSGIFRSEDPLMTGRIVMPLDALQRHLFREGTVSAIDLVFEDPGDPEAPEALERRIAADYPGVAVQTMAKLGEDNRMINLLEVLSTVVVWTVALAGIAGTANIMLMAVNERRAEIGLLIAVGWSPARILSLFLLESVILATISGLAGIGLGVVIIEIVRQNATLAAFLADDLSLAVAAEGLSLAIGIGAIGGVMPALRVLQVPADEALRSI